MINLNCESPRSSLLRSALRLSFGRASGEVYTPARSSEAPMDIGA